MTVADRQSANFNSSNVLTSDGQPQKGFSQYDPANVIITLGTHVIEGYADGEFITLARNNDIWTQQSGASGESVRAKSNDQTGIVTLTLMQTSFSNKVLQNLQFLDERDNSGRAPLTVRDTNEDLLWTAPEAWVQTAPDITFAKEMSERVWVLGVSRVIYTETDIAVQV